MNLVIDSRPLYQLTVSEFNDLLKQALTFNEIVVSQPQQPTRTKIIGIRGLAAFLNVCVPTAQKLKNQKKIPFYESGNKVYFFSDEVDAALRVKEKGGN